VHIWRAHFSVLTSADTYTIKNAKKAVQEIQEATAYWKDQAHELSLPSNFVQSICKDFIHLPLFFEVINN
jgi:hypothetical protein